MLTDLELRQIFGLAVDGMLNDGAHHKTWYLQEIAKILAGHPALIDGELNRDDVDRPRSTLEARLAEEGIFFDDGQVEVPPGLSGDWWEIESGVAP